MTFRNLAPLAALAAVAALAVTNAPASAAKGMWSLGGNFGTGTYSNSDLNDILKADTPPRDEVKSGWEYGGSLRYGISSKLSLDAELNAIKGSATTNNPGGDGDETWRTQGMAMPINLYYALSQNESFMFNVFAGAGPMFGSKLHASDNSDDVKSDSKTVLTAQGGLEGQYLISPKVALGARVLGRTAKVDNIEIDGTPTNLDLDMSGFSFGLGLRMFFGGGQ
jgi:hypothetical protein